MNLQTHTAQDHDPSNITNPQHVDEHEVMTPAQQLVIFIVLFLITMFMVFMSFVPMGIVNPFVTIGCAFIKAFLVIFFFMHMKSQSRLIKATVASGFFILGVLMVMSGSDYMSRAWGMW